MKSQMLVQTPYSDIILALFTSYRSIIKSMVR